MKMNGTNFTYCLFKKTIKGSSIKDVRKNLVIFILLPLVRFCPHLADPPPHADVHICIVLLCSRIQSAALRGPLEINGFWMTRL